MQQADLATLAADVVKTMIINGQVPAPEKLPELLEAVGKPMKMLRRHIWRLYGLTPEDYRRKWGLPPEYPPIAPNYAKQKSKYAKRTGLGTHRMRQQVAARRQLAAA